ncbi:MAG: TatD family hydrolase [Anaeromyxobacter sp.]
MIDTHCHLDRPAFDADRAEVLARAAAAGVTDVVIPAIGPHTWAAQLALGSGGGGPVRLHHALGLHPQLLPELDPRDDDRHLADLEAALGRGGAVAVGECGLDGEAAASGGAPMDRQVRVLEAHLALAARHGLPVLLHGLRALDPLRALLERAGLPAGGVFHSFSGSADQVAPFVALGLHLALAGPVTYEKARKPLEAARAIPRDRLLLETDAPDQCPRPHRGRNEPAYLALVRDGVARALGVPAAEVEAATTANARRLFRLP